MSGTLDKLVYMANQIAREFENQRPREAIDATWDHLWHFWDPRMRELQMQQLKMTKDALPIGGCLPMILQFPLLIAFYTAVTVSLDVRQASFLWLPDLSAAIIVVGHEGR